MTLKRLRELIAAGRPGPETGWLLIGVEDDGRGSGQAGAEPCSVLQQADADSLPACAVTHRAMNGWFCWNCEAAPGRWVKLDDLRRG